MPRARPVWSQRSGWRSALEQHAPTPGLHLGVVGGEAPHRGDPALGGVHPVGEARPLEGNPPVVLEGRNVRVTYTLRRGGAFRGTFHDLHAVDGLSLQLKKGEKVQDIIYAGIDRVTKDNVASMLK